MKLKFFLKMARKFYPDMSRDDLVSIWTKSRDKVLDSNLSEEQRIRLAVRAYIRHELTDYDKNLETGIDYRVARRMADYEVKEIEQRLK